MDTVKTAVSIQKPLFEQAEDLARKLKISRSRLFGLALEEFIRRSENRDLLEQINAAYADEPDTAERTVHRKARQSHRRTLEGEW
ncbi:MAG: hypothetical protein HY914_17105 [Desulfomonile tiedjei]|nr:hypothetical protein [Desulfomonile tiedjei]